MVDPVGPGRSAVIQATGIGEGRRDLCYRVRPLVGAGHRAGQSDRLVPFARTGQGDSYRGQRLRLPYLVGNLGGSRLGFRDLPCIGISGCHSQVRV